MAGATNAEAVLQEIVVAGARQEEDEKRRQASSLEEAVAPPSSDTAGASNDAAAPAVVVPPRAPLVASKAAKGSVGGQGMVELMLSSTQEGTKPPLVHTPSGRTPRLPPKALETDNPPQQQPQRPAPLVSQQSNVSQRPADDTSGPPAPSEFQFDDLEEDEKKERKSFYHHYSFWGWAVPMTASLLLLTAGILLYVFARHQKVIHGFELWRWCIFFSLFPPIWFAGDLFVRCVVTLVESQFLRTKNVMYYMVAMRKPLANLLRASLLVPLFVVLFHGKAHIDSAVYTVYDNVLKFIGCLVLFCLANVLKTLIAKKLAFHFHKSTHFQKMQEAIRKEYYLLALSAPRHHSIPLEPTNGAEVDPHKANPVQGHTLAERLAVTVGIPTLKMTGMKRATSTPNPHEHSASKTDEDRFHSIDEKSPMSAPSRHVSVSFRDTDMDEGTPLRRAGRSAGDAFGSGMGSPTSDGRRSGFVTPHSSAANAAEGHGHKGKGGKPPPSPIQQVAKLHEDTISLAAEAQAKGKVSKAGKPRQAADDAMLTKISQLEKHIRKKTLAINVTDSLGQTGKQSAAANSEAEARKLAFYLYWNIKPYFNRNHICLEDLQDFLSPKEAEEAFAMLDHNGDGKVSLAELREAVTGIFRERSNLAAQLKDTKTVVGRLELVVGLVLHVIFVFFYLSIFNVNIQRTWVMLSSVVLAFAFVFGNSIRSLYEAVIFLFIVHPFDVGDTVIVDTETYKVEEISLTVAVLKRGDGGRVWYPISKLSAGVLLNLSRSDNKWDKFKFLVDMSTPVSVLDELTSAFEAHFEEQPTDFTGSKGINFAQEDKEHMKVAITVGFEYSCNGVDAGRTTKARTKLLVALVDRLKQLGVQYTQNPQLPYEKSPAALAEKHAEHAAHGLPAQ